MFLVFPFFTSFLPLLFLPLPIITFVTISLEWQLSYNFALTQHNAFFLFPQILSNPNVKSPTVPFCVTYSIFCHLLAYNMLLKA